MSMTVSRCTPRSSPACASGSTIRPPVLRYGSSAVGTCVAPAVTTIASTSSVSPRSWLPSPCFSDTLASFSDCRWRRALATSAPMRSTL